MTFFLCCYDFLDCLFVFFLTECLGRKDILECHVLKLPTSKFISPPILMTYCLCNGHPDAKIEYSWDC